MIDKQESVACTGCHACGHICEKDAISYEKGIDGFLFPVVDYNKCVMCGKCISICPECAKQQIQKDKTREYFLARNKEMQVILDSSSGGVFSALAKTILQRQGIVYGVGYDSKFNTKYLRVTDERELSQLYGSKYVSTNVDEVVIKELMRDALNNNYILFVGTPCQVEGIRRILIEAKLILDRVYLVDFYACSGGISSDLWREFLNKWEQNGIIKGINFRNKKNGWRFYNFSISYEDKQVNQRYICSDIGQMLAKKETKRISCTSCRYRTKERNSDLSLSDYWNAFSLPKKWNDDKGTSLCVVHSNKGNELLGMSRVFLDILSVHQNTTNYMHFDETINNNEAINIENRNQFWSIFHNDGLEGIITKYNLILPQYKQLFLQLLFPILIKLHIVDVLDYYRNNRKGKNGH